METPISVLHAPTLALRRLNQTAAPLIRQAASKMASRTPKLYGSPGAANVLVYTGPGTSKFAVENTLTTLKALLVGQYDVMSIDAKVILNEPWQESTAMLVIPGGRDLPYVRELSPRGTALIKDYVEKGGRYMGICAGAYFGCDRIEFEKGRELYEVTGDRDLKFFHGLGVGSAYPGFVYDTEAGARAIDIVATQPKLEAPEAASAFPPVENDARVIKTYHNGGCAFVEDETSSVPSLVLARYAQPVVLFSGETMADPNPPAVVLTRPGQGYALLSGAHIEYDAALVSRQKGGKEAKLGELGPELMKTESDRTNFMKACLLAMGLRVGPSPAGGAEAEPEGSAIAPMPTTAHLTFGDDTGAAFLPDLKAKFAAQREVVEGHEVPVLEDSAFRLRMFDESELKSKDGIEDVIAHFQGLDLDAQLKAQVVTGDAAPALPKPAVNFVIHKPGQYPSTSESPYFNHFLYHETLSALTRSSTSMAPMFGAAVWHSHVIPSTQTLLDKNFKFSTALRDGFTAVATHQTAGRGRGRNSWISPLGCLQFSLLLSHPRDAPPVVFIQYLFALAVCEAVRSRPGCEDLPVHIKWPNDVYAKFKTKGADGAEKEELKKLGGILVNSSFYDGKFLMVIGHGLNVANATPSTCLNSVLDYQYPNGLPSGVSYFTQEEILAAILHRFRILYYDHYLTGGFDSVEKRYRKYWIHQDQVLGIENLEGKVKIKGINSAGELVVVKLDKDGKERAGKDATLCLTPDGNGFDMMRGLLVAKST
ncbi:biotin-protein ligase [Hyaloraphidium curvatum]|nr:biotin-protein ligase [Hyaloraphidium curvatum]